MALRYFKCPLCGHERETMRSRTPTCNHSQEETGEVLPVSTMEEIITAPNQKFMIAANPHTGTSKIKDNDKVLKARARNHSRDVLGDETIQINKANGLDQSVARNLLNPKGERRRKIDDI